jgi:serine/threonine-protein kinase
MNVEALGASLSDRYRIERELGAGGMATVYLAADLKHDRQVAIKVLKPDLAAVLGAERFVQEIKTTAALSHPHILPLFDSGEAGGYLYYVMPYLQGETIRDRLNRETQLGIEEALKITTEVADALDYAHQNGVIHRDIKPENILLHHGRPMVMDFGIALAVSAAAGGRMTETGLSLGTPHYMSPEQATADKSITGRSDIYSLASVCYEMLAGEPPHSGGSAQAIIMKIVTDVPRPVAELRKSVPTNVAAALMKALEKLPADRFDSAKAFAEALADRHFTIVPEAAAPGLSGRALGHWLRNPISLLALVWPVVVAGVLSLQASRRTVEVVPQPVVAFTLVDSLSSPPSGIAVADDGTIIRAQGGRLLVRRRGDLTESELPLPEGLRVSGVLKISPGGTDVAHFIRSGVGEAERYSLRRTSLSDGTSSTLWTASSAQEFAWIVAWGEDGWVYFSKWGSTVDQALVRVRDTGGDVEVILPSLVIDAVLLPGAETLVTCQPYGARYMYRVIALDLASGDTASVASDACSPGWLPTGHLLLAYRDGTLRALPFDPDRLMVTGPPMPVLEGVAISSGRAHYAVSRSGMLVYVAGLVPGEDVARQMALVELGGGVTELPLRPTNHGDGAFSPDGRTLAYVRDDQIWLFDLDLGTHRQFTTGGSDHLGPTWSPDGARLAYGALRGEGNQGDVYVQALEGDPVGRHIGGTPDRADAPTQWLSDGTILFSTGFPQDILTLSADRSGTPEPVLQAEWGEVEPKLSPDERWLSYATSESGSFQVVVRAWPGLDRKSVIAEPDLSMAHFWAPDGRTLYYQDGDSLMAASLSGSDSLVVSARSVAVPRLGGFVNALHPDGRRFLVLRSPTSPARGSQSPPLSLVVVTGWLDAVNQRLAASAPR